MASLQDAKAPYLTLTEQAAAPTTPGAGDQRLYTKTDGKLYRKDDAGTETEVGGGSGGGAALLTRATFSAGGTTTAIATTSATMVDADATNLAVTFTVPSSGKVKLRLEALGGGTGTVVVVWGIREGTTVIQEAQVVNGFNNQYVRVGCEFVITGLTPGASKTYKWGHYKSAGTEARIYTGGAAGSAIMSVHDASLV